MRNIEENRWIINKIGLINFWYYDEQEFYFSDGKLLLRGANGSGKSVTMQSFVPLLLDGNKSPERLDPFGSRARKLENYLLSEDNLGKEENTGYLYMEFIKPKTGNVLTIGMGLRARRGKPMDFWGFSITDGRRIGGDFYLYKDIGEKLPLSKQELKNRIGSGGTVTESQSDYMAMVNNLLFGFESLEEYDELIKLLVQLRTPKLSREFKPTVIYEIMNNSLQPLSDDDLRPLSEAIENMDKIKIQLEMLEESKKAADKLKAEYDKYNRFVLHEKADSFINCHEKLERQKKVSAQTEEAKKEYYNRYIQAEEEQQNLKFEQQNIEHKKQQLEQSDVFKAKQEIDRIDEELNELDNKKKIKEQNLQNKKDTERQLRTKLEGTCNEKEKEEESVKRLLDEMSSIAEDLFYYEHQYVQQELLENLYRPYDFKLMKREFDRYKAKISEARKALEQQKREEKKYDDSLKELEAARKAKESSLRELDRAEALFDETKEEFIEKVYSWEKGNTLMKIPAEEMPALVRAISGYGVAGGYDEIITEARRHFNGIEKKIGKEIIEREAVKEKYNEKLKEKQADLDKWKNKKDPEPYREDKVVKNRQWLEQNNIPFVPLYKAVDFRPEVSEELKGKLEEALMDMGLLDALIIPRKYADKIASSEAGTADRYIFPNPQFLRHDLSLFLKPVVQENSGVSYEDIDNALKSIVMDDKNHPAYISEDGHYSIGIIHGDVSGFYSSKFIGAESRRRYRQEIIQRLEEEIREIRSLIEAEEEKIGDLKHQIEILYREFDLFPQKIDLETAHGFVVSARQKVDICDNELIRKQEAADKVYKELKAIREKVLELTLKIELPRNLEAYEQAEEDCLKYRDMLGNVEVAHSRLLQMIQMKTNLENQINDILADMDDILYDLTGIARSIQEKKERRKNYEAVLKQFEYEQVKDEIDLCIKKLREIPGLLEQAIRNAESYRKEYEKAGEKLQELQNDIKDTEVLNNCLEQGFMLEYELGYVAKYEDESDPVKIAKKVLSELKGEERGGKTREDFVKSLQEKYHENYHRMAEYVLRLDYIFEESVDNADDRLKSALASRKRLDLFARIQGKEVDFFSLVDFIEDSIRQSESLLRESDRQLFEDILANTVGKKIRAKIYHSEEWVKKMNALMESMNTSSGLSFSLAWKSKAAETDEQLNTRELVELLQTDAVLLKDSDMSRLTTHFRSKIALARKELEDKGGFQSFHAIMKDILDYRKWFEFQLFYKKTGEPRKELTDNAFYKFSGGEKAMAMYVPLFSSVYARYEGARRDCPRIISLDEAFAGVDENNIRDMFRLLEELKLSFIINSQSLWGDYDTVTFLSIYELIRPNNADFVTTIRYRWNGKVKEFVPDKYFGEDELPQETGDEVATAGGWADEK